MVSRFLQRPRVSHLAAAKRILRYLKGNLNYGILFPIADKGKEFKLVGYTNSSWCSVAEDRKSTTGYVFMLGGAPVAWSLRKEPVMALSSRGTEYIDDSLCACQATWMVKLFEEITDKYHGAITIKIDSMLAINLAKNPISHGRSKHIEIRFHYLRENVADGKMNLEHYRTENQIADIMTKGVHVEIFRRLILMMNIDSLDIMN
ncbi:secreted RxLR effector protein 161-like [Vicia villosa]|uniref:secreted RxLR effector protein 161-like n=1 Tax=Vicia villosa TaxID=3911 RepID=UPI00273A7814|nr:secreted RxLR effector protein 161-like [Vicia villosa]